MHIAVGGNVAIEIDTFSFDKFHSVIQFNLRSVGNKFQNSPLKCDIQVSRMPVIFVYIKNVIYLSSSNN